MSAITQCADTRGLGREKHKHKGKKYMEMGACLLSGLRRQQVLPAVARSN